MPVREQTEAPEDDAACRFYGQGANYADLAVDLSQFEDDVLSDADAIFENSARFNHGHPRTLLFGFDGLVGGDSGTVWRHGTGGNLELLTLNANGTIDVYVNNTLVLNWRPSLTGLGITWIAWASEANPDPDAGVGDAVHSWLYVYTDTHQEQDKVRFTHPAKNSESTTAYVGASSSGGTSACTEQITTFGCWSRFMTFSELADMHWAAFPIPGASVAATERQPLPPASGTVDAQNEPHGPAAQLAGAALSHTRWRTMGALYNARFRNVPTIVDTTATNGDDVSKFRPALGATNYVWHLGWFRSYPVSPTANALFVRVHARVWSVVPGLETGYWGLRVWAFNRRPVLGDVLVGEGEPPDPLESRSAGEVVAQDNSDSDDPGRWRIDAVFPVVRGTSGISRDRVYIALGYAVDPDETNTVPDEDLRLEVKSIELVQLFNETVGQPPGGGPSGEAG